MDRSSTYTPAEQSHVLRNTGIALIATVVINLVVYFIADAAGWIPEQLPERAEGFGIPAIIIYTVVPIVAGGVLLSILIRVSTHPVVLFCLIAAVVFIASLFAPLLLAGAAVSFRTVLVVIHVLTAVVGTYLLVRGVNDEPD